MEKIKSALSRSIYTVFYKVFSLLPLSDKVVGSSFCGKKYENNPRFVFEKLQEKYPKIKKLWIKHKGSNFELPSYVTAVTGKIHKVYEYATAKVIIDSHFLPMYYSKRQGQLAIFMYHGGIGIKRNSNEVPGREKSDIPRHNAENNTFFISNSNFTSHVIRSSLEFSGPILKCGYPKDDPLFDAQADYKKRVCEFYGIPADTRFLMYAPTYRQDINDHSGFNIDLRGACTALSEKLGGTWTAIVKWHPKQGILHDQTRLMYGEGIIDATEYSNMQELIIASDAFISDYSSCIFEAAERGIPCFSYATDWNTFKYEQGVHFEIDELPFPYCQNNDELLDAIIGFDDVKYQRELASFLQREGLCETGKASEIIADIISEFVGGNVNIIHELDYEEV